MLAPVWTQDRPRLLEIQSAGYRDIDIPHSRVHLHTHTHT